jgi:tRNA pseudouridine55 synthase
MPAAQRSGVLVVDKAPGLTSFDVVALVRRRLGQRRVGHAGTLDPDATGVLPILLGEATKLMPYLQDAPKEYVATLRLGVRTDTQDLRGRVVSTAPVPPLTVDDVRRASLQFVGRVRQVPPMYSAVHHEGRRLYELAREGVEVEREAREVVVHAIDVEDVSLPAVRLRIVCGKGTYVRALAADLGDRLGCGAAVERLRRLRVGPFGLADAVDCAEIAERPREHLLDRVLPPAAALEGWPTVTLPAPAADSFCHGQAVQVVAAAGPPGSGVVVRGPGGALLGLGEIVGGGRVKPVRILHADHPGPRVLPT